MRLAGLHSLSTDNTYTKDKTLQKLLSVPRTNYCMWSIPLKHSYVGTGILICCSAILQFRG